MVGGEMSLAEKVKLLREQLGLKEGPLVSVVDAAAEQLGLTAEVASLGLMQKCDVCLRQIGMSPDAPVYLQVAVPVAVPVEAEAPLAMGTVVSAADMTGAMNGRIEFLGLWKDTGSRAMPIKMGVNASDPHQVRRAFDTLVGEMRRKGVTSGTLAAQSYNQMHWSANPNEQGYQRHGFIGWSDKARGSSWSKRTHRHEGMRIDGYEGVIDVLGGDWQNAVYRVTLAGAASGAGAAGASAGGVRPLSMERETEPGAFDAYRTEGCYFGSCILPVIWTTFYIHATGPDTAQASGASFCLNVIPIPWSIALTRSDRRLRGLTNPQDPNSHAIFDFNHAGNCYCQKGGNEEPIAWGVQLCGASCCPCCIGPSHKGNGAPDGATGSITSHDMKGTWVICAPPFGWSVYKATPYQSDPNRYHEQGLCCLFNLFPLPTDEVWTRAPHTNNFHKDKNPADVVTFCCASYGNEKGLIHKCKVCP